jgi:hypothetical protein
MSDENKRKNKSFNPHRNRLTSFFKEYQKMQHSENFDEFFHGNKNPYSKAEWEKLINDFHHKMKQKANEVASSSNMIIMFEDDYQNLLEMRGFFRMNNHMQYVETINKILNTLQQKEI